MNQPSHDDMDHVACVVSIHSPSPNDRASGGCARDVPEMCPRCARGVPEVVVPEIVPEMCPRCARGVPEVCPRWLCPRCAPGVLCARGVPEMCPRCARDCAPGVPQVCPRCASADYRVTHYCVKVVSFYVNCFYLKQIC